MPIILASSATGNWGTDLPIWLDRAPLNTDFKLLGIPFHGFALANLGLAVVLNLAVLVGLLFAFAKDETDFEPFVYIYLAIFVGSGLVSSVLRPVIHAGSLFLIMALTVFLLIRFCLVSYRRAVLVTFLFHVYQILYILAFRAVARSV